MTGSDKLAGDHMVGGSASPTVQLLYRSPTQSSSVFMRQIIFVLPNSRAQVLFCIAKIKLHAFFMVVDVLLHFYYWHFTVSWNQISTLHLKYILIFIMALSVSIINIDSLLSIRLLKVNQKICNYYCI